MHEGGRRKTRTLLILENQFKSRVLLIEPESKPKPKHLGPNPKPFGGTSFGLPSA